MDFDSFAPACERPLATSSLPKKAALIPQMEVLRRFEQALCCALRNEASLQSPVTFVGPTLFLGMIEDLLWLLTRPAEGLDQFFVHWRNDTVVRLPRRLFRHPGARPWLGDFPIQVRRGLVAQLATLAGDSAIRQRLFCISRGTLCLERGLREAAPLIDAVEVVVQAGKSVWW